VARNSLVRTRTRLALKAKPSSDQPRTQSPPEPGKTFTDASLSEEEHSAPRSIGVGEGEGEEGSRRGANAGRRTHPLVILLVEESARDRLPGIERDRRRSASLFLLSVVTASGAADILDLPVVVTQLGHRVRAGRQAREGP